MYSFSPLSFELNGHGFTTIRKHKYLQYPVLKIGLFESSFDPELFASVPHKKPASGSPCFRIALLDDMQALARIL
jgi:hypothetical protein